MEKVVLPVTRPKVVLGLPDTAALVSTHETDWMTQAVRGMVKLNCIGTPAAVKVCTGLDTASLLLLLSCTVDQPLLAE